MSNDNNKGKPVTPPGHSNKPDSPPGRPDNVPPARPSRPEKHRPVGIQ